MYHVATAITADICAYYEQVRAYKIITSYRRGSDDGR